MHKADHKPSHRKRIKVIIALIVVVSLLTLTSILFLRSYLPTYTKSFYTNFKQYAPTYLPKDQTPTRGQILVNARKSDPNQYIKVLSFSAGDSLNFEEERDGEITPKTYRASCSSIKGGLVDACNDAVSPSGQKYVYTDHSYKLGTTLIIVSWRMGDTYLSITSTDPTIASSEYAKIIDSMRPTLFTKAVILEK